MTTSQCQVSLCQEMTVFQSTDASQKPRMHCLLAQVVATLAAVAGAVSALASVSGPGAVVLGGGLALSSTAVAMQVLQDRGESGSRHGRATFAVLLLQVRRLS